MAKKQKSEQLMKKTAQQPTIDFKRDEINRAVNDALTNLNTKMQAATQQLNDQVTRELKNIINNLQKEVATKVNEIKSLVPTTQTQTAKDQLSGGKGDDLDPKDVNKDELKRGIEVETEHTKNKDMAKEIALDHLAEDPKYYTHLEKVHKESGATPAFWRRNYDYLESPYMNTELIEKNTKNAEFLRDLVKLADKLDASGLRKEADRIDRIIRIAVEEWEYHGYGSPEEYERVRRMRRPELYEGPEGKEKVDIKEHIEPEIPADHADSREFGETLGLLRSLIGLGGRTEINSLNDGTIRIRIHSPPIDPDILVEKFDFDQIDRNIHEKDIESFRIGIYTGKYTVIYVYSGSRELLNKLEQELKK